MVSVWRWYHVVCRKSKRLHKKAVWSNKWIQKSSRIQSQHTKIGSISIHEPWALWKGNYKNNSFIIVSERITCLGINLTKEVKGLHHKNYKTFQKEIKEDIHKWTHIPCSWIGRLTIVKVSVLPKAIYRFNVFPSQILMVFFAEIEKSVLKFTCNLKGLRIAKTILEKKNKTWGKT